MSNKKSNANPALPKIPLALFAGAACLSPSSALAQAENPQFIEPAAIDRAVAEFTGAAIGEIGGSRTRADARLRLAACQSELALSWYGSNRSTVQVECPGPQPWRIFIATRAAPLPAAAQVVVRRGDPMTVVVRGNGFSVQQSGEAIDQGAVGDWIGVRTSRQSEPVRARIERPGLAVIPIQ